MGVAKENRSAIYKIDLKDQNPNDVRIIAQSFVEPNTCVLDVGCACGDLGVILNKTKGSVVFGMEYDPKSIEIAKSNGCYQEIHQVDLNKFKADDYPHFAGMFDYIIVLDVLEHLISPQNALEEIKKFLKPDGSITLSLPNIAHGSIKGQILLNEFNYADMGILDKTHLRFFTEASIASMLNDANLKLVRSHARIVGFASEMRMLPFWQRRFISKDPHSFIFQYVVMVRMGEATRGDEVELKNLCIPWDTLNPIIQSTCRSEWKNRWLPEGTLRHKLVKALYQLAKK